MKSVLWCLGGAAVAFLVVVVVMVVFSMRVWDYIPNEKVIEGFEANRTAFQQVAEFMVKPESPDIIRDYDYAGDEDNLRIIFETLRYRVIRRRDDSMVWFIRSSLLYHERGLVWSPTGDPPFSVYLVSLVPIDEHWFLYEMDQ